MPSMTFHLSHFLLVHEYRLRVGLSVLSLLLVFQMSSSILFQYFLRLNLYDIHHKREQFLYFYIGKKKHRRRLRL